MREELRTIGSKGRHVFTATFVRFGFRNGYIGPVKTILLQDVTLDSKIVSDHLWFDLTKGFSGADLSPGDVVEFRARVSAYEKGYKGHKDDVLLNLEDVFEEAMYNEATLKEEFTSSVRLAVIRELKEKFKNELMREISNPISQKIEDIARESMSDLIENASEKKYRFRLDYMDEELTVDEFIRGRMKKVVDSNIETMVESKAKSFVNELRKRYDMAFAAFVVDNMRKQNMLKEDKIAELLKDNPNEK